MTNVKISPKGKAFLRKAGSSTKAAKAIVRSGSGLTSREGIVVNVNGTSITIKASKAAQ